MVILILESKRRPYKERRSEGEGTWKFLPHQLTTCTTTRTSQVTVDSAQNQKRKYPTRGWLTS